MLYLDTLDTKCTEFGRISLLVFGVMYNSGCKKVINLFNQERKDILKYGEFCAKYNIRINILDYHALTQSIPKLWKNDTIEEMRRYDIHLTCKNIPALLELITQE